MSDFPSDAQDSVICHCSGTTEEKIITLIRTGVVTLDDISRKTGVCSGCGSCECAVMELLAEYNF
ncbi:MAG: (2Fe-2S)-binding protein [Methylococcaceae bacterium]|nr:(2Fe-2S)-binding protein [Methylococcaceae bacterium]MDZ4219079.1 (2Fe-2S)-binding protein [Methylobacter sp.]MDP2394675.1 (2Fe-2S)-binding protein [Methylococcaceae bacterium]MDP3019162.1 (2Fe-2S)-binding protein [Methylococcaceae bacterium]MDP3389654.1 (2Fe-2S)-binding protein [Methylococcaceae bacterium]